VGVVRQDVQVDSQPQLRHTGEAVALDAVLGDAEPVNDFVTPGFINLPCRAVQGRRLRTTAFESFGGCKECHLQRGLSCAAQRLRKVIIHLTPLDCGLRR